MATPVFIRLCEMVLNDVLHVVKESLPDVAGVVSLSPVLEVTDAPKVNVIPLSLTLDVFDRGTQAQNASVLIELTGYVGTSEISAYASYFEAVEKLLKLLPFATYDIDDNHFKATVTVSPFPTFYRWMFGWNGAMKIKSPKGVIDKYKTMARKALES